MCIAPHCMYSYVQLCNEDPATPVDLVSRRGKTAVRRDRGSGPPLSAATAAVDARPVLLRRAAFVARCGELQPNSVLRSRLQPMLKAR